MRRRVDWGLKGCCNTDQIIFLATAAVCSVLILALWRTLLIRPFKLVLIVIHEASHAIACKLTCGRVEGIEVYANESGKTTTRGGNPWVVLPAGYIGASFWGMMLMLASTNLLTARIAAGCLATVLLLVLLVAKTLLSLSQGQSVAWYLPITEWKHYFPAGVEHNRHWLLQIVHGQTINSSSFAGTMTSVLSAFDIYSDLICQTNQGSDAALFAQKCDGLCGAVTWGVVWGLISLVFFSVAFYFGLADMLLTSTQQDT
ncbi:hypothetical protein AKJ16_DCAP14003 [Drosera capensis]